MDAMKQADLEHTARLLAAFGGTVDGWEWDGEMAEQDPRAPGATPCACGQVGLRFLFSWTNATNPGKVVITGSTCVEKVPGISGESVDRIQAALAAIEAKKREAERKAAEAARTAIVMGLRQELAGKVDELTRIDQGGRYWHEHYARCERAALRMKSAHGQANRLRGYLESIGRRIENVRARNAAYCP